MLPRTPWLALVLTLPLAAQAQVASASDPRARARQAVGEFRQPAALFEGHGTARVSGVEGKLTLLFSPGGSFRREVDSALPARGGYDGHTVWLRDHTGLGRVARLEDADQLELVHWILSGFWLEAPTLRVGKAEGGTGALRLRFEGSPLRALLSFDAEGLPAELVLEGGSNPKRWTFGDYREVNGRRLAHRWTVNEEGFEDVYRIESFAPSTREAATAFRPELTPPADVRFDTEVAAELQVTRMTSGHLLVEPLIEDTSFGAFIFDTGAGITVLDKKVADELLLEVLGTTVAVGVAGAATTSFRRGERFQLGPVTIENPIYGDLDLSFMPSSGPKIAGIVGYDLFARCVVELEVATARISLHDPATYTLAKGQWQELLLDGNDVCAYARYEGERQGLFRLDTGDTDTVTFHAPTVRRFELLKGREVRANQSSGVGGSASAPEGVLQWFELAGHRFELPRVQFSQATSGAFTDVYTDGNIGQAFLKPFKIVLDYPHDRIAFVPL